MKCPFHGTVVSVSAYEQYLRLAEVLTLQGMPNDHVHRDQHLVTIVDQCEGSWLYLLRMDTGNLEKVSRYGEIIAFLHSFLRCISPQTLSAIRQTVKREAELNKLVSLLERQQLLPGELVFLVAHWTSELFFTRTDIDLKYLAKLLDPNIIARIMRRLLEFVPLRIEIPRLLRKLSRLDDVASALMLANRISKCLRLNTQLLAILNDFLSVEEFNNLRKEKLSNGSGIDSPGASGTKNSARELMAVTKKRKLNPEIIEAMDDISRAWCDWGRTHARLARNKLGKDGVGLQGRTIPDLERRAKAPLLSVPHLAVARARRAIVKFFQNAA